MKGILQGCLFASFIACITTNLNAQVIQRFYANTYTNPADFGRTNDLQFAMGVVAVNAHVWFKGQVFGQYGRAVSSENVFPPYFLIAKRLNPKWTLALNISQPILAPIDFPPNSVVAPLAINSDTRAAEINPLLVYQISESLSIGAGPTFQDYYRNEISYVDPVIGYVHNNTIGWAKGWDAGLNWAFDKTTFLSFAYFSKLDVPYHGTSAGGFLAYNNTQTKHLPTPTTLRLDLTHYFTPKLLGGVTVFYTNWSSVQVIRVVNVVPTATNIPVHYKNQIAPAVLTHYDVNEKVGLFGLLALDQTVNTGEGLLIGFPATNDYIVKVGFDYKINKEVKLQANYGFIWGNAHINHPIGLDATGREPIRINALDLRLTYSV